ncbi:MAG TPA: PIN domain-containing protein [Candidatus Bathyarchaeia archaeon]|nr:PIN domain-containing protein [Candidatus Bathyarchaeia archaeon]
MNTGIIVDTCVWIEFFRKSESKLTLHLKDLLRERKVIMAGMVMAEILQGVKAPKEAKLVKQSLGKLPYLEITRDIWEAAGAMSASLRSAGITIPLSDLIIACVALSGNHEILTIDPYFEKVDGLRLYNAP